MHYLKLQHAKRGIDTLMHECHAYVVTTQSSLYRMIEKRLPVPLTEWVEARRSTHTWKAMAGEIVLATDIEVSHETIRRWFSDDVERAEQGSAA